jgi:predicted Zn-dependent protease
MSAASLDCSSSVTGRNGSSRKRRGGLFSFHWFRACLGCHPRLASSIVIGLLLLVLISSIWTAVLLARLAEARRELQVGRDLLEHYHQEEARPHLEACLRLWPDNAEVLLLLARAARRANALDAAEQYLNQYRQRHGSSEQLIFEEILQTAAKGEVERVSKHCRQLVEHNDPAAPLILEALAQGYLHFYRLDEGYAILQIWLQRCPQDTQALFLLAGIHMMLRHHPEAIALYQQILHIDPEHGVARRLLASVLIEDLRHDEAVPLLEQLRQRYPDDAEAAVLLAKCRYHLGQQREAEQLLDEVLAHQPHFAPALAERGRLALVRGQWEDAQMWLREAAMLQPSNYPVRYHLFQCLQQNGKIAEAEAVNWQMAQLERNLNRVEALTIKELRKSPNDPALQHELGCILLDIGQVEEGLQWLYRILRRHPFHLSTHRTLAEYYQRAGDTGRAAYHRRFLEGEASKHKTLGL